MAEIHLLFISIDNTWDMMNAVLSVDNFRDFGIKLKKRLKLQQVLGEYTAGRNTFEHFDDKMPGGKNHSKVKPLRSSPEAGERTNLGGLKGRSYTFGDQEWDVSPLAYQKVHDVLIEFEKELHEYIDGLGKF